MFYENYETRLKKWLEFREKLETDNDPIQTAINFWNKAPISNITCDPFDKSTWLGPWDLIEDNNYCEFSKLLAIYYTLVLTDRFSNFYFEIQIVNDREAHELKYILIANEFIIGYHYNRYIDQDDFPLDVVVQISCPMILDLS